MTDKAHKSVSLRTAGSSLKSCMDVKRLGWKADRSEHMEILFSLYYQRCRPKETACLAFVSPKGCYMWFSSWRLGRGEGPVSGLHHTQPGPCVTAATPLASNSDEKQSCWVKKDHFKIGCSDPQHLWARLGSECSPSTQIIWVITLAPWEGMVSVVGSWELCRSNQTSTCPFHPEGAFLVGIHRNLAKPAPGPLGQWGIRGAMGRAGVWKTNKFRNAACLAALCRVVTVPAGMYPSCTYLEHLLSPSEHFLDQ